MSLLEGTLDTNTFDLGVDTSFNSAIDFGNIDMTPAQEVAAGSTTDIWAGLGNFFTGIVNAAPSIISAIKGTPATTGAVTSTVSTSTPGGYVYGSQVQQPGQGIDTNMILLIGVAIVGTVLLTKVMAK